MKTISIAMLTLLMATGCASKIQVYDEQKNLLPGVPVRAPVLVDITTETTYEIAPTIQSTDPNYETIKKLCEPTKITETSFMAIGQLSYVSFEPAWFGKGEFKIELSDSGQLKVISVNSDAAANAEAASKLLGTVLPFIAAPKPTPLDLKIALNGNTKGIDLAKLRAASCIQKESKQTVHEH